MKKLIQLFALMAVVAVVGCGPNNSVDTPENPDPPPSVEPGAADGPDEAIPSEGPADKTGS